MALMHTMSAGFATKDPETSDHLLVNCNCSFAKMVEPAVLDGLSLLVHPGTLAAAHLVGSSPKATSAREKEGF